MLVQSLCWADPLEVDMATHCITLAWRIPDRGAWWAAVHRVAQSQTQLKRLSRHTFIFLLQLKYGRLINRIEYNIQLWKLKGYECSKNGLTF